MTQTILVTGGAGYVGARLIPALVGQGRRVRVLDLFLYGTDVFPDVATSPNLTCIKGDIRNMVTVDEAMEGVDSVIHLACISNDPSFELDPVLGKSINLDAFRPLVESARRARVARFIYASSSSVYGVKDVANVTEDMELDPLTDYSRYKADCEAILGEYQGDDFTTCVLRPATVCGYSPRQRLDVIVNIFANLAFHKGEISVFGGEQKRPNIHIKDMVRAYLHILDLPDEMIAGKIYNVGYENYSVKTLAEMVRDVVGPQTRLNTVPTDDIRSYHVSSERIRQELGFEPQWDIQDAVAELRDAFENGLVPDALNDIRYYNIKTMQALRLN